MAEDTKLVISKQLGERGVQKVATRHGNLAVGNSSDSPLPYRTGADTSGRTLVMGLSPRRALYRARGMVPSTT